jgi:hypothetical protein
MMRGLRLAGTVAAVLVLAPFAAAASDQDDALRLAERVASRGGFIEAAVTLHGTPKDFPSSIPLPKATLLGSVVESVRQGGWVSVSGSAPNNSTTFTVSHPVMIYYDAPSGREAAVAAYEKSLRDAGWKPQPAQRHFPFPQGGFQMTFPQVKGWCSPAGAHTAVTIIDAQGTTGFDLNVLSAGRGVDLQCSDAPTPFDDMIPRSPLPTFTAPAGITITASGPATDGSTTGARIESKLGIAAVFEAFAKQLRDAGWTGGATTSAAGTRTQTFTKTDGGKPYVTLLAIYALDATHYVALTDVSTATE